MLVTKALTALAAAGALVALAAAPALAYTMDSDGKGFVGKGEVQTALGWNNSQLQNGTAAFTAVSTTETVWTCSKDVPGNDKEVVINRHTRTTSTGVVSSTARLKNQITGFHLNGFSGSSSTSVVGPAVGSCPDDNSGFVYDDNAGAGDASGSVLKVNGVVLP